MGPKHRVSKGRKMKEKKVYTHSSFQRLPLKSFEYILRGSFQFFKVLLGLHVVESFPTRCDFDLVTGRSTDTVLQRTEKPVHYREVLFEMPNKTYYIISK